MRKMITSILNQDDEIEVMNTAVNGKDALDILKLSIPDIITCDVEMPIMDGVTTVKEIRKINKKIPIIMYSMLTTKSASVTMDAMAAGATDYITKPANVSSVLEGFEKLRNELVPKIKGLVKYCG